MRRPLLLAAPAVALAGAGLFHPAHLTYATSARWTVLHVAGLFVFPLVGVAFAALVWGRRDLVARVVLVASYVYATAYSALDIIAGISAGYVTHRLGPDAARPDEVRYLFDIGNVLGGLGVLGFLLAAAALAADRWWLHRSRAIAPGVLLVAGAVSFLDSHIYPWRGVVTMLVIGVATGWLALLDEPQKSRAVGSSMPRRAS